MSASESAVGRLLQVLEAEEALYVELRDVLQAERHLMVTLDATGLEQAARRKEELADEICLVEESRLAVAAELAAALELGEERPTLSKLCETLGGRGLPLRSAHTRLLVLVSAVRELLDANAALAGDALGQVRGTLRLLGGLLPGDVTYERKPAPEARLGAGTLLRRHA